MNNNIKTACLFGGQGSQYIGMGKEFYDLDEDCRQVFKIASEVMEYDMAELCFYGNEKNLNRTTFSLPCMLTIDLCAYLIAIKRGFTFQAVAGFSLGEYAALAAAQVVPIRTSFELVKNLLLASNSILKDGIYGMAAVNLTAEKCDSICSFVRNGYVKVANYNSKNQVTIAGNKKGLDAFTIIAQQFGGKIIPINVDRPYHSERMKTAAQIYAKEIEKIQFSDATIPIYMNVTGEASVNAREIKSNVVKELYSPVLWTKTLENMYRDGMELFVECGLKKVLCRILKDTLDIDKEKTIFLRAN